MRSKLSYYHAEVGQTHLAAASVLCFEAKQQRQPLDLRVHVVGALLNHLQHTKHQGPRQTGQQISDTYIHSPVRMTSSCIVLIENANCARISTHTSQLCAEQYQAAHAATTCKLNCLCAATAHQGCAHQDNMAADMAMAFFSWLLHCKDPVHACCKVGLRPSWGSTAASPDSNSTHW